MTLKAPAHLKAATKAWWLSVVTEYELRDHHRMLLTLAAEAYDRTAGKRVRSCSRTASSAVRTSARAHPCIAIERDSRLAFARLVAQLTLDEADQPPIDAKVRARSSARPDRKAGRRRAMVKRISRGVRSRPEIREAAKLFAEALPLREHREAALDNARLAPVEDGAARATTTRSWWRRSPASCISPRRSPPDRLADIAGAAMVEPDQVEAWERARGALPGALRRGGRGHPGDGFCHATPLAARRSLDRAHDPCPCRLAGAGRAIAPA